MNPRLQAAWIEIILFSALVLAAAITALPIVGMVLPLLSIDWVSDAGTARIFSVSVRQILLLARSVLFSALVATGTSVIGAALAVILIRSKSGKKMLALILPPLIIIPPAIHGINWTATMMTAGEWLSHHGLIAAQPGGWFAADLAEVLSFLPVAVAIAWAGLILPAGVGSAGRDHCATCNAGSPVRYRCDVSAQLVGLCRTVVIFG